MRLPALRLARRIAPLALASLTFASACGKKGPDPVAADTATAATQADAAEAPKADVRAADVGATPKGDVAEAPKSDVVAADTTEAAKVDAAEAAKVDPNAAWLVWLNGPDGYATAWVTPGEGGFQVVAIRAEAAVVGDGTLWGVQWQYTPFQEMSCEDFDAESEGKKVKPKLGPKKYLPSVVARGLVGTHAGEQRPIFSKNGGYSGDIPTDGSKWVTIGEHWGRTIKLVGGSDDALWAIDCEGGYGCGAHGDNSCSFQAFGLSGKEPALDRTAAAASRPEDLKAIKNDLKDDPEVADAEPELEAVSLTANGGDVQVEYRYVWGVPYSGSDGSWASYSASRAHTGPPAKALALGEVPAPVKAFLADKAMDLYVGWSTVPVEGREALLTAFKDASTLGGPKPEDEVAADNGGADAKVAEGRKATKEKRYAEAIAAFDAAVALQAGHARAWSGRGYAKLLSGDAVGAKADFEHALTLDSDAKFQAAIYFNLGELAEQAKDKSGAISAYEKVIELAPSDAAKKRLKKLREP